MNAAAGEDHLPGRYHIAGIPVIASDAYVFAAYLENADGFGNEIEFCKKLGSGIPFEFFAENILSWL